MERNENRILRASALGGGLFVLVALLVAPQFSLLGLLSGACAGGTFAYLRFDLGTVWYAVRNFWNWLGGVCQSTAKVFRDVGEGICMIARTPKPFTWMSVVSGSFSLMILRAICSIPEANISPDTSPLLGATLVICIFAPLFVPVTIFLLYFRGAERRGIHIVCQNLSMGTSEVWGVRYDGFQCLKTGDTTYDQFLSLNSIPREYVVLHNWSTVITLARVGAHDLWTETRAVWCWGSVRQHLAGAARQIHCHQRTLCALSAIAGGEVAYWMFARPELAASVVVFAVVCGGALAAAVGLATHRLLGFLVSWAGDRLTA